MGFTIRLCVLATAAIILVAIGLGTASVAADSPYQPGSIGNDISAPQCNDKPIPVSGFGIVGVNTGKAWTVNPCLAKQSQWASGLAGPPSFYLNTANPGPVNPHWTLPGPRPCLDLTTANDKGCAYNYGWNSAGDAFTTASNAVGGATAASRVWWLDVETANSWDGTTAANAAAIQGFIDALNAHGVAVVGIYSTILQWRGLTSGYSLPQAPNWISSGPDVSRALSYCTQTMTGGPVWLVQVYIDSRSGDYACPGANASAIAGAASQSATSAALSVDLPAGPPLPSFPNASCSGTQAAIAFNWKPTATATTQWLDLSVADNNFAPGTFSGAGPLGGTDGGYTWRGLQAGTAYFWRVNDMTPGGWMTSATGAFVACGGPQLRGTSYACTSDGRATVTFFVAPPSPLSSANWLDISLYDNGFAPGSFLGNGPNDGARQQITWPGILPNLPTYWRYNSNTPSGWVATQTGNFTVTC